MTFFLTKQYTRLAFTLNVDEFPDPEDLQASDNWTTGDVIPVFAPLNTASSFLIYGMEVAETGQKHFQGYVEFKNKKLGSVIKRLLPGAHFEGAVGTAAQNIEYCSKEATDERPPFVSGEPTKVGRHQPRGVDLIVYPAVPNWIGQVGWGPLGLVMIHDNVVRYDAGDDQ